MQPPAPGQRRAFPQEPPGLRWVKSYEDGGGGGDAGDAGGGTTTRTPNSANVDAGTGVGAPVNGSAPDWVFG